MSLELHVILPLRGLPAVEDWQAAVSSLSLPLQLDSRLDLTTASGFVPCRIGSADSGFELWPESVASLTAVYPGLRAAIQDAQRVLTFRWGGDMNECACTFAAAAGLVVLAGALVYSPNDERWYDVEELRRFRGKR